jgi:hypothetical protein
MNLVLFFQNKGSRLKTGNQWFQRRSGRYRDKKSISRKSNLDLFVSKPVA